MSSRRYQQTLNRQQEMLLPARVEEYVSQINIVRAIDAYVNTLDIYDLGFKNAQPVMKAGQPPYNPSVPLKLYLYGYLQGIRSSRKIERETCRNLEVIWLIEGLRPTYKTIANFRKDNSLALRLVNRDFILLCKELSLLGGEEVAVDGSFFSADTSKDNIYTEQKLNTQLERLETKIAAYQEALLLQDLADDQAGKGSLSEDDQLEEKLKLLKEKQAEKTALKQALKDSGSKQISTIDPDARLLSKRGKTIAGYNVQIVVDSKNKLIVADDVTQDGNDSQQLAPMLKKAQQVMQSENLTGLADTGYYEGNQLKQCEDENICVYVAIPDKSQQMVKQGLFTREQFKYDAEQDIYNCPNNAVLEPCGNPHQKNNKWLTRYASKTRVCNDCPLREKCLTKNSKIKQIHRWEHENVVERHKARMNSSSGEMIKRGAYVEHPFGTLKHRAGMNHFMMRGLEKCRGEFSLMVLGYNFTRAINLLGVGLLLEHCLKQGKRTQKSPEFA
jgi:transposase